MTPTIRFCRGPEGANIAFSVHGAGPPLVCPDWWVSHLEEDWRDPRFRGFFERLGATRTIVRYDRPGVGLSDRQRKGFDLPTEVAALSAVVDHLGLGRFALLGISCGGAPAVAYAAENPTRVDRLVLYGAFRCGSETGPDAVRHALLELVRANWGLGARTLTDLFAPDLDREQAQRLRARQRASASPEMAARLLGLTFDYDVRATAPSVAVPALVLHRRGDGTVPFEAGRALAGTLPNATFVPLDGTAHVPWEGEQEPVLAAILEFLGNQPRPAATVEAPGGSALLREGDVWTISYAGQQVHLKHSKGLSDLAMLLANPGREIHALDLRSGEIGSGPPAPRREPVLDERARSEFEKRARDIEAELAEAETNQDAGRVEALRSERELLLEELEAARGLGGRDRFMGDATERARKAVLGRIRDSIRAIAELHPGLGEHLEASIRTGTRCCYAPEMPVIWRT